MNRFRPHVPDYVDIEKPSTSNFKTTEDLLKLEVVQRYGKEKKFSHFALSDNCLMQISDEGFSWWVIGYIKKPNEVNLPKWDGAKYRAKLPDGSKIILSSKEVRESCGNELTLKDGTKAIWLTKQ